MKFKLKTYQKTIIENFSALFSLQLFNYILPLVTLPFLIRVLDTKNYGLVVFAQTIMQFFIIIIDYGLNISATRELSLAKNNINKQARIFSAVSTIKFILVALSFLVLLFLINVVPKLSQNPTLFIYSFGIAVGLGTFPAWFFQGIEKMKYITILTFAAKMLFTLLIFAVIRQPEQYLFVPVFNSLGYLISSIIAFYLVFKYIPFVSPLYSDVIFFIKDSFILLLSSMAARFCNNVNVLFVGFFIGDAAVGIYASMEKLILAIKSMFIPIFQAIFPWLSAQGDIHQVKVFRTMIPYLFLMGALIYAIILMFGQPILHYIYNNPEITNQYKLFGFLGLISFLSPVSMLFISMLFPAKRWYYQRTKALVFGGLINTLFCFFLIKPYGIWGAAFAAVVTEVGLLLISLVLFKTSLKKQ